MAAMQATDSQALCVSCEFGPFTRNHYFTGKLMLERDFSDETRFHMEKLRHHNQRLHGWGVVCGLQVVPHPDANCHDRFVIIEPGTGIDCCGHEIVVREPEMVELARLPAVAKLIQAGDTAAHALQICLRFRECPTEEIPVLYNDCGCDENRCAPNRILESFDVDAILDPPPAPPSTQNPRLVRLAPLSPNHARRVAVTPQGDFIYALEEGKNVLYQVNTQTFMVSSVGLNGIGLEVAVAHDGKTVYVVTELPSRRATKPRQLVVFGTAGLGQPVHELDIAGSGSGPITLAPTPDNRLLVLLAAAGQVQIWGEDLNTAGGAPKPVTVDFQAANLSGLAVDKAGGRAYTLDPANDAILVLDLTAGAAAQESPLKVLPAGSKPTTLAMVSSTGPDQLVVASQANHRLYLVGLSPANPVTDADAVQLDHEAVAVAVTLGGQWAYVLERDSAGAGSIQVVNLPGIPLRLGNLAAPPGAVGKDAQQIVLAPGASHVYVPFIDTPDAAGTGGIAVFAVEETACADLLRGDQAACPACDAPNCLVLATIMHYHVGDRAEAQTEPPADPAADAGQHIARIDNRAGRRILPSTQRLAEAIECILKQGTGGAGGAPGPQGPPGQPGLGIDKVDATFLDCVNGVPAAGSATIEMVGAERHLVLEIPKGCDGAPGQDVGIDRVDATFLDCVNGVPATGSAAIQVIGGERHLVLQIPKGCDGAPGQPGPGIDKVDATFLDCVNGVPSTGSASIQVVGTERHLVLQIPKGCDGAGLELGLTQINALSWVHRGADQPLTTISRLDGSKPLGIVIGFSREVFVSLPGSPGKLPNEIDAEHVFQVLIPFPDEANKEFGLLCRCPVRGQVVPVDLKLNPNPNNPELIIGATEISNPTAKGAAFIFDAGTNAGKLITSGAINDLWVILRGDFVIDRDERAIDAEFVRGQLPTGDRPKGAKAGIQGGTFESWFRTKQG